MLDLYRRHTDTALIAPRARAIPSAHAPIWCDGELNGKRHRRSLKTRDWARAAKRLAKIEDKPEAATAPKNLADAIALFESANQDLSHGTKRNQKRTLNFLQEHCEKHGLKAVEDIDLEAIDLFRAAREISALTWTKELQILRHFFKFCLDREWIEKNPAKLVSMPKNLPPAPREPYTQNDIIKIIAAADQIGMGAAYERLRARAMVLLLRYTGLRVSDVATLAKDRIRDGQIHLYTTKNGKPVLLPRSSRPSGGARYTAHSARG